MCRWGCETVDTVSKYRLFHIQMLLTKTLLTSHSFSQLRVLLRGVDIVTSNFCISLSHAMQMYADEADQADEADEAV